MAGPFTGRRKISGASESGARDKYTPGTYYSRVVKGVFKESEQVQGAEYFGIETAVVYVVTAYSADENAPYDASRKAGANASWTWNLNPPNRAFQYLADGNVKNLCKALSETEGFVECLSEDEASKLDDLMEAFNNGDENSDPYGFIGNLLVSEGGEKFAGLPIKIVARDGRSKNNKNTNANLFCACTVYPVDADELAEFYG